MIHLHLITRKQAREHGLRFFYTGEPCKYNQYAERRTSNGTCICFIHDALLRASSKEWRKNNNEGSRRINRNSAKRKRTQPCNPTFEVKK